jgi:hypothetical protein
MFSGKICSLEAYPRRLVFLFLSSIFKCNEFSFY